MTMMGPSRGIDEALKDLRAPERDSIRRHGELGMAETGKGYSKALMIFRIDFWVEA